MNLTYRYGTIADIPALRNLAVKSWSPFKEVLTEENWNSLRQNISSEKTFEDLIRQSTCIVCVAENNSIIGMAFLVPHGNPTDIYLSEWCYIRYVSVDPEFAGQGIGKRLTIMCIDLAKQNREKTIALHTSEIMNKARHIYESLGFTILREIDKRLGKSYWLYTLELNKQTQ